MEKRPQQFGIPKEVFDHPETVKALLSTMKDLLTICRGAIKLKVCHSFYHGFMINNFLARAIT